MNPRDQIKSIENTICDLASITREELRSPLRSRTIADARMIVWYILHNHLGLSHSQIAKIYKKDNSTITYGVNKVYYNEENIDDILHRIILMEPRALDVVNPKALRSLNEWDF